MKVETTGNFMLIDIHAGQEIAAEGETEVRETHFVRTALDDGRLREVGAKVEDEPKPTDDAPTSGKASKSKKDS